MWSASSSANALSVPSDLGCPASSFSVAFFLGQNNETIPISKKINPAQDKRWVGQATSFTALRQSRTVCHLAPLSMRNSAPALTSHTNGYLCLNLPESNSSTSTPPKSIREDTLYQMPSPVFFIPVGRCAP